MRKQIRSSDILARRGGDEFAWLTEADKQTAAVMEQRIRMEVANTSWFHGEIAPDDPREKGTISCGISEYREEDRLDSLLQRAGNALYRRKKQGKNEPSLSKE